ncbi:MAG: metallophosphatase family protein [Pseudomonadota bacterium]|nr:metallophosphatase family protein [Pseudomonadota bacterium]
MKIFHAGDLHYSNETLEEVDRCFAYAVEQATGCEVAVLSGDSTDHRQDLHSPAVDALARQIVKLTTVMPVLMLQGTFSHEPPGTLNLFGKIGNNYPVFVADRIGQVALTDKNEWIASEGWRFHALPNGTKCLFTVIPTVNRCVLAATIGAENASTSLSEILADLMSGFTDINMAASASGIPTVLVSHGTVTGCITEHGFTMASLDHEFTTGILFSAGTSAVMLSHIHKHQHWENGGQSIAYAGSIGRLHYGEEDPKGFIVWDVTASNASFSFKETPARKMLYAEFNGEPDMDALRQLAGEAQGAFVRVRWQIDEEHQNVIDRAAIEVLFEQSAGIKLEGRILPIQRTRAEGINNSQSFGDKLAKWCEVSNTNQEPLSTRLESLLLKEPDEIVASILQ